MSEQIRRPLRGLIQDGDTQTERAGRFRAACPEFVRMIRQFDMNYVFRAAEGFAKTSSHFDVIQEEARTSSWDGRHGFTVVACRSRSQAAEKMKEYKDRTGGSAVLIQSLRAIYEQVCEEQGSIPARREGVSIEIAFSLPGTVANRQPRLPKLLRNIGGLCGEMEHSFNQTKTILFTTHATVRLWDETRNTRIWHHPGFDLSMSDERADELRADFRISRVVYDELEIDEFLTLVPENLHDFLARQQQKVPDWRDRPYRDRWSHFVSLASENAIPAKGMNFDGFDSLMRLNLSGLQPVTVDFEGNPVSATTTSRADYTTGMTGTRVCWCSIVDAE